MILRLATQSEMQEMKIKGETHMIHKKAESAIFIGNYLAPGVTPHPSKFEIEFFRNLMSLGKKFHKDL